MHAHVAAQVKFKSRVKVDARLAISAERSARLALQQQLVVQQQRLQDVPRIGRHAARVQPVQRAVPDHNVTKQQRGKGRGAYACSRPHDRR